MGLRVTGLVGALRRLWRNYGGLRDLQESWGVFTIEGVPAVFTIKACGAGCCQGVARKRLYGAEIPVVYQRA